MQYTRKHIANLIFDRLTDQKEVLKAQFSLSKETIGYFFIDDLLPIELANEIYQNFPALDQTVTRKDLREFKHTAYQMDKYNPLLEEVIYAFQDERIVELVASICSLTSVYPDEHLYAGGLSLMAENNFLNPHLDNSHDKDRSRWRVLNLLYYVTPEWELSYGGNLELWQNGLESSPTTIESKFNRLAVMITHQKSWHSVSKVVKNGVRCCVSNYYFSDTPVLASDEFHITTFRGRPEEKGKDLILKADNFLRSTLRKLFKKGVRENPHQYKK